MKIKDLNRWKGKALLYSYDSYDEQFLKDKLHKACKVIDAYNSNNEHDLLNSRFTIGHSLRKSGRWLQLGDRKRKIHFVLDIIIELNEQHKCKEDIN